MVQTAIPTRLQLYRQNLPRLVERLRRADYKLGMTQHIDAQHLLEQLATQGRLPRHSAGLQAFFAPLLCHTPQEQEGFDGFFTAWSEQVEGTFKASLPRMESAPIDEDLALEFIPETTKPSLWQKFRQALDLTGFQNLSGLKSGIFALAASALRKHPQIWLWGLSFIVMVYFIAQLPTWGPDGGGSNTNDFILPLFLSALLAYPLWRLLKLLWHALRDGFLARHAIYIKPEDLTPFYLQGECAELFHSATIARNAQQLRRHRKRPNQRLDIAASLQKTIRAGGWFSPVWGCDKQIPEYLVLIDRLSFRDHQAHFAEALLHQLVSEGVEIHRYYFDADPRYCYPAEEREQYEAQKQGELPAQQNRGLSLEGLLACHENHRMLIFSDGNGLFDDGRPTAWLEKLCRLQQPALFTLTVPDTWRLCETLRMEQDLAVFPANPHGLNVFTRFLETGLPAVKYSGDGTPLPSLLMRTPPAQWMSRIAPDPQIQQSLLQQLRARLGEPAWQWFSACALYPELRWPLTLELGFRSLEADPEKLKRHLPKLARLPWFRYGSMPNWLRLAIIDSMGREEEKRLRAVLRDLMSKTKEQAAHGIPLKAGQLSLLERLKQHWNPPENELRDTVLLDFVENRLTVRVGREVRRLLRNAKRTTINSILTKIEKLIQKILQRISPVGVPEIRTREKRSVRYTSAKIVLMGDSGVGKTGLGWRLAHGEFKEHASTHGQQFWVIDELRAKREDGTECEAVLWDLAGQHVYRSVHAISLDDVDAVLVLFDPCNRQEPLKGAQFWLEQLATGKQKLPPAVLVGARTDRDASAALSQAELERFCRQYGISGGYVSTSAKSGEGLELLLDTLRKQIPWEQMTATVTTVTFKRIKEYILALKEQPDRRGVLVRPAELRTSLLAKNPDWQFDDAEMMTAVKHLENHGYVAILRASSGVEAVLLAPELLADLASSIVLQADKHPRDLWALSETALLRGDYAFSELDGLETTEKEILLDAATERFLNHKLCFREILGAETLLIFPGLIKQKRPLMDEIEFLDDVSYLARGRVENVYAALVVLLGYTRTFIRINQWQNQALYEMGEGEICGFRLIKEHEDELELVLYYSVTMPEYGRTLFQNLFEKFLYQREVEVTRFPPVICAENHRQERTTVVKRIREGKKFLFCEECGEKVILPKIEKPHAFEAQDSRWIQREEALARLRSAYETHLARVKGFRRDRAGPRAYISSLPEQAKWVAKLRDDLLDAGVYVIQERQRMAANDWIVMVDTPLYQQRFQDDNPDGDLIRVRLKQGKGVLALSDTDDFRCKTRYVPSLFDLVLRLYAIPLNHPAFEPLQKSLRRQWEETLAEFAQEEPEEEIFLAPAIAGGLPSSPGKKVNTLVKPIRYLPSSSPPLKRDDRGQENTGFIMPRYLRGYVDIHRSRISQIYGERPTGKSQTEFSSLLNGAVNGFVVVCCRPGDFLPYLQDLPQLENFVEVCNNVHDEKAKVEHLITAWEKLRERHNQEPQKEGEKQNTRVVLLPRLSDTIIAQPLFNQIRTDIFRMQSPIQMESEKPFKVVFMGDYLTLEQLFVETGDYSSLGKELAPNIWIVESLGTLEEHEKAPEWLTGSDENLVWYFDKFYIASGQSKNRESWLHDLRRIVHTLVSEMLFPTSQQYLEQRLRHLKNLPSYKNRQADSPGEKAELQRLFSEMYALLPGTYDAGDKTYGPYGWYERRHSARWRPYSLLRPAKQALLMGGFIRCEAGEESTQFRLRNPLLAYVVARHGMSASRWKPQSKPMLAVLRKSHTDQADKNTPPTSLDYFLELLLNKAIDTEDGEADHWTVAKLDPAVVRKAGKPGEWWKRLPAPMDE
ncbi:MAG: GTP-binding protein [Gammaproteobacteria bacterium]|nr:GTP-binding protein [Gammaproteobacteria bacterium]